MIYHCVKFSGNCTNLLKENIIFFRLLSLRELIRLAQFSATASPSNMTQHNRALVLLFDWIKQSETLRAIKEDQPKTVLANCSRCESIVSQLMPVRAKISISLVSYRGILRLEITNQLQIFLGTARARDIVFRSARSRLKVQL